MKHLRIPKPLQSLSFSTLLTILTIFVICGESSSATRPFWTQTPSYIEGEFVYVVGTVSHVPSLDDAKRQAFIHGKLALMNFAQISEVGAEGLTLEARHTYVENNPDGSVNAFQLLRIPSSKVLEAQARLQAQRKAQTAKLEASQHQLSMIHKVLITRQQTIDEQTASIDSAIQHITEAQQKYSKKSQEIDRQQAEITKLELTLEGKFAAIDDQIKQVNRLLQQYKTRGDAQAVELENFKKTEGQLQANETELQRIQKAILARLQKTGKMACHYISPGMAPADVKKMLGKPAGEKHSYANERYDTWAYGTTKVNFDSQGVVASVTNCNNVDTPSTEKASNNE